MDKTDHGDNGWPDYLSGRRQHVHAVGVISLLTAQFERGIDTFHAYHWRGQSAPDELIDLYYFSLNEEKRLDAIGAAFEKFEKDGAVKEAIENLLAYFRWCRDTRNKLLHSEAYPPTLGGDPDLLYLIKRLDKRSTKSGYMKLSLTYLRAIADQIRAGIVQSAKVRIYLRVRDFPSGKIDRRLQPYATEPLPELLTVPKLLRLTPKP